MSRFQLLDQLRKDLEKAKADLASRKTVERAKALLMKERGLEEEAAYRLLRKLSMDTGRPLGAVAADLLDDPHRTLASIAHEVGYGTAFALSAAFKRERGISPAEHRRSVARARGQNGRVVDS